ncbi:MAG: hypothetical protein LBV52_05250 [Spirochaetaceae bacterium]|jgi:Tfp pilus assembly protein PilF|nr:hypothetical protein [Spirochaetaceae bacterium]
MVVETDIFPNKPDIRAGSSETEIENSIDSVKDTAQKQVESGTAKKTKSAEIREAVERGSYDSLHYALDLISDYNIQSTEYGRLMSALAVTFLEKVYSDIDGTLPRPDPPQTDLYAKILKNVASGIYTYPQADSIDYFELTLPFLALMPMQKKQNEALLNRVVNDLEKAEQIQPEGVIAVYFLGLACEKLGLKDKADAQYKKALIVDSDFFPAVLGETRIMQSNDSSYLSENVLEELSQKYPKNIMVLKQLGDVYYTKHEWSLASHIYKTVLDINRHNPDIMLKQVRVLIELRDYINAQMLLDSFTAENPDSENSRFLFARLQYEGYKNSAQALDILRAILKKTPVNSGGNTEALVYMTKILLESSAPEDQEEGRGFLNDLLESQKTESKVPLDVLEIAVQDALQRSSYAEAKIYQEDIVSVRRSAGDLLNSFTIEQGLGNRQAALSFAAELHQKYPADEDGNIAYASALLENGRRQEARNLIDRRLSALPAGVYKSKYYFLRSRLQYGDAVLNDLRSSIFENPRNIESLKAIFEVYHRQGDEKRAIYYLKQAIALAPLDPDVIRYQKNYQDKL